MVLVARNIGVRVVVVELRSCGGTEARSRARFGTARRALAPLGAASRRVAPSDPVRAAPGRARAVTEPLESVVRRDGKRGKRQQGLAAAREECLAPPRVTRARLASSVRPMSAHKEVGSVKVAVEESLTVR